MKYLYLYPNVIYEGRAGKFICKPNLILPTVQKITSPVDIAFTKLVIRGSCIKIIERNSRS